MALHDRKLPEQEQLREAVPAHRLWVELGSNVASGLWCQLYRAT